MRVSILYYIHSNSKDDLTSEKALVVCQGLESGCHFDNSEVTSLLVFKFNYPCILSGKAKWQ